ncbi:hypothetical protein SNE40_006600 [Patella caerulea]
MLGLNSNSGSNDEEIVDSLVNHALTLAMGDNRPGRKRSPQDGQAVMKSKAFVSRSDADLEDSGSSSSSPKMDFSLRIRPESPTASYESTSFESIRSDELGESCPLIFSVDDVGLSNIPKPLASHPIQNVNHQPKFNDETRRARSDSEVLKDKTHHISNLDNSYQLPQNTDPNNNKSETNITNDKQWGENTNMKADESYVYQSNLMDRPVLQQEESPGLGIISKIKKEPFDFEFKPKPSEDSPEYLIYKLDCQIQALAGAVDSIFCGSDDKRDGDITADTGPGAQTELEVLVANTKDSWKKHKENLFEFLGDFEQLEYHLNDAVIRLHGQSHLCEKLKHERREFQSYLEEREQEWMTCERSLKTELEYLRSKLFDVSKQNLSSGALWKMLESLMSIQFDREQAMILDTAKQNKLNEMKLLIFRQRLLLEEAEEKNFLLLQELDDISTKRVPQETFTTPDVNNHNTSSICDVMYCDRQLYLPRHSTQPELASLQVFNVGGRHPCARSAVEEIFEPDRLPHSLKEKRETIADDGLAEDMLRELTLNGPGSPSFSLDD